MIDHTTAYPVIPGPGDLWRNEMSDDLLFIYMTDGGLKGISSAGRPESDDVLAKMEHGKGGWKRAYPAFQAAE
jgi:hypothetical protein